MGGGGAFQGLFGKREERRDLSSFFLLFKSGFQPQGGEVPLLQDGLSVLPSSFTHSPSSHTHTQRCIVGWFQWLLLRRLLLPSLPDGNKEANVSARAGDTLEKERGTDPGRYYFKGSQPHTLAGMGKPSKAKAGGSTGPPSHHSNLLGSL